MSYFAGMRAGFYRRTPDGRRVCARRSILPWRKRWYYVTPAQESRFETRMMRMHLASFGLMMFLIAIIGDRLLTDPRWLAGLLVVVLIPGLQTWTTSGLEAAPIDERSLVPRDQRIANIELARAYGATTLWFLLAASIMMAAGQVYVIVTDGAWWAWLGLVMFIATSASAFRQLLLLRTSEHLADAS